jgi:hypothetical protein
MDTINVQYFYGLGFAFGRIQEVAVSGEKLNSWHWSGALESAKEWATSCSKFEGDLLPKTRKAAVALLASLDEFSKLLGQDREANTEEWRLISSGIENFYKVFEQEVEDTHCFVVTPVGAYAVTALLVNASSHLSQRAQQIVDDEVKVDFNQAGTCLALDLYTACGFHAMRAVEAEARYYHKDVTGVELKDVPLGKLIYGDPKSYPNSGLRTQHAKEGSSHDDALGLIISLLSQINAIYRRPIMHPEMSLSAAKAKFVFDTAAIAISAMVTDAVDRLQAKVDADKKAAQPQEEK